jgi:hypothetical protein
MIIIKNNQLNQINSLFIESTTPNLLKMSQSTLEQLDFIVDERILYSALNEMNKSPFSKYNFNIEDTSALICLIYIFGANFFILDEFEFEWFLVTTYKMRISDLVSPKIIDLKLEEILITE